MWGYQPLATARFSIIDDDLIGTSGANRLVGTGHTDHMQGLLGNDTLLGRNGADILVGGGGHGTLKGDTGHDKLLGALATTSYLAALERIILMGEVVATVLLEMPEVIGSLVDKDPIISSLREAAETT